MTLSFWSAGSSEERSWCWDSFPKRLFQNPCWALEDFAATEKATEVASCGGGGASTAEDSYQGKEVRSLRSLLTFVNRFEALSKPSGPLSL